MRVPIGCFVLMSVSFRAAQTSQELRSKYDEPDIERFTARPGIGLTVEFGSDGVACQELLEPLKPLHHRGDRLHRRTRLLRSSKRSRRRRAEQGKRQKHYDEWVHKFEIVEYENVPITRSTHNCVPSTRNGDVRATVSFKCDACRVQSK